MPSGTPKPEQPHPRRIIQELIAETGLWEDCTAQEQKKVEDILDKGGISHPNSFVDGLEEPMDADEAEVFNTPSGGGSQGMLHQHTEQQAMFQMMEAFGVDMVSPEAQSQIQQVLAQKISTVGEVLKIMTTLHKSITQVDARAHALKVEAATCVRAKGAHMVWNRTETGGKAESLNTGDLDRVAKQMLIIGKDIYVRWMPRQSTGIKTQCKDWGGYDIDKDNKDVVWVLQTPPLTCRKQKENYAPVAILTFVNFPARQAFMNTFAGWTPTFYRSDGSVTTKKIRSAPAGLDFQRQLEVPLRTVHKLLNIHKDTKGKQFISLWWALTAMEPQEEAKYEATSRAMFRLD